jgi:hypothetical protein
MISKRGQFGRARLTWTIALVAGLALGRIAGVAWVSSAAAVVCGIDRRDFSDQAQSVTDDDDGVADDNRWAMHQGRDYARSLSCDDGTVTEWGINGQTDNDDVGTGSGGDEANGGLNNDEVYGGESPELNGDALVGGDGADLLRDLETDGPDVGDAGDGGDVIDFEDGDPNDSAVGGNGEDTCYVDSGDQVNCEYTP